MSNIILCILSALITVLWTVIACLEVKNKHAGLAALDGFCAGLNLAIFVMRLLTLLGV